MYWCKCICVPALSSHKAGPPWPSFLQHLCFQHGCYDRHETLPTHLRHNNLPKVIKKLSREKAFIQSNTTHKSTSCLPDPTLFRTMAIAPTTFRCFGFSLAKICNTCIKKNNDWSAMWAGNWLSIEHYLKEASNSSRATFISVHPSHDATSFDVSSTSVIRNALQHNNTGLTCKSSSMACV